MMPLHFVAFPLLLFPLLLSPPPAVRLNTGRLFFVEERLLQLVLRVSRLNWNSSEINGNTASYHVMCGLDPAILNAALNALILDGRFKHGHGVIFASF